MNDRVSILTVELRTLQEQLNVTTSPEAHSALLTAIRSKLKELDDLVKRRLERVYGLGATATTRGEQADRNYDIFERLPGGGLCWRGLVAGSQNAIAKLTELAQGTPNELFACELRTNTTIARMNVPSESELRAPNAGTQDY